MLSPHCLSCRPGGRFRPLFIEPLENRICLSGQAALPVPAANLQSDAPGPAIWPAQAPASRAPQNEPALAKTQATSDYSQAVQSINDFALDLYQYYQQQTGNLFLSPMSIATALAMTFEGANGQTAAQMANVLHLGQPSTVGQSFQALLAALNGSQSIDLSVADALWPKVGYPFLQSYLQLIQSQFGGGAQNLNYAADPAGAARIINAWVAQQTNNKIKDLISPDELMAVTRLVLTNAVYFKGQWATPFAANLTDNQPFYLSSGAAVQVPMMYSNADYSYTVQDGYQVLDLPYQGGQASMVVLLPQNATTLTDVSGSTLKKINDWLSTDPGTQSMIVRLPKFQMTVSSSLKDVLERNGDATGLRREQCRFLEYGGP